jgi:hypothetical protein
VAEGQFVLRARAGPALEEAVSFFCVDASRSPAAFSDAIWHTFFLHACTVGLCKYVFLLGWLQCLRDAVDWGRLAIENNSLLVVFVYCFGRVLSAVLCL